MLHQQNNASVQASIVKVIEYPFHWHPCIEIITVLKGSIYLIRRIESKVLNAGDAEIVNIDEAHYIGNASEDNVVVIFQIKESFAEKYYPEIRYNLFNCSLFPVYHNNKDHIVNLKQMIFKLAVYLISETRLISSKKINDMAVEILNYLMDHFEKMFQYKNDRNDEQSIRLSYEFRKNSLASIENKDIGLKAMAEKNHISMYHISHDYKKRVGYPYSFALTIRRISHGVKLLLSSDMNIYRIATECGYSASRYFKKNFRHLVHMEPLDFREKYQKGYREFNKIKKCIEIDETTAENFIRQGIEQTEDLAVAEKNLQWIEINLLRSSKVLHKPWLKKLNIFNLDDLNQKENQKYFLNMQSEIGFFRLNLYLNLKEVGLWLKLRENLAFLRDMDLDIRLVLRHIKNNNEVDIQVAVLKNILEKISLEWGQKELKRYKFCYEGKEDEFYRLAAQIFDSHKAIFLKQKKMQINIANNLIYDTLYMAGWIVKDALEGKNRMNFLQMIDDLPLKDTMLSRSSIFQGKNGLLTAQGLIKPAYYGYYFLSLLGDEELKRGEGYIVTKKKDSIQILLYNEESIYKMHRRVLEFEDFTNYYLNNKKKTKHIKISFANLHGKYIISRLGLNQKFSVIERWSDMGRPSVLNTNEISLLNGACFPERKFDFIEEPSADLKVELPPYGIECIQMRKASTKNAARDNKKAKQAEDK